jgi:hypothetical protein
MATMTFQDTGFELRDFKAEISAILKRHCCYSNDSWVTSVKSSIPLVVVLLSKILFVFHQVIIVKNTDLNHEFSVL